MARSLDMPTITGVVLQELQARVAAELQPRPSGFRSTGCRERYLLCESDLLN